MLFPQSVSRLLASFAVVCSVNLQWAAVAQGSATTYRIPSAAQVAQEPTNQKQSKVLLASACPACGAPELATIALAVDSTTGKGKKKSLLTDSLWGNLILELAYDRDPELSKLAKRVRLLNGATTASVFGIAGGTLAQGISALYVLNPPNGGPDSYAPLFLGTALSGTTMIIIGARAYLGHQLAKHIEQRQIQLRDRVQNILSHLEYSQGQCQDARQQLKELIGERACSEWIQLWQSSHKLAQSNDKQISINNMGQTKIAEAVK
jgi:hypothetical protein